MALSTTTAFYVFVVVFITLYVLKDIGILGFRRKGFPGPTPYPFVGHVFQVPTVKTWKYFERLSHAYGPIFQLSLGGDSVVVLNKARDAEELLAKRSSNYSSRKPLVYAGKYQSNNKRLVLLPYGETLKRQRTAFHKMLQPRAMGAYETMQDLESLRLLHDMYTAPEDAFRHCQRFAASLVFVLSYGKRMEDNGRDLDGVIQVLQDFVSDTYPGAHLVDMFPFLDRLPDFCSPWRAEARRKHGFEMELYSRLLFEVKNRIDAGEQELECFAARLWDQHKTEGLQLEDMAYVAGSAFEAGTDTTAGTMQWFMVAALLYPDAIRAAQAEIDGLLGSDGTIVPDFGHINSLPYCAALTREIFRFFPAAPGGFPHYSDADDEYTGIKIKGKTMVIPCLWTINHDAEEFPDPYCFNPARFLQGDQTADLAATLIEGHYGFGFGRRKCPGLYLGSKTIWIGIVRLLWAFDFAVGLDEKGAPATVDADNCTSGMTTRPIPFPIKIAPRSPQHAQTILDRFSQHHQ